MLPARPPALAPGKAAARSGGASAAPAKKKKKRLLRLQSEGEGFPLPSVTSASSTLLDVSVNSPNRRTILEEIITPSNICDAPLVEMDESARRTFSHRLVRFFSLYEPSQVPVVSQWMDNWRGREAELLRELIWFHGPEPPMSVPLEAMEGYGGRVHSVRARLLTRARALLINFLTFYAPERLAEVDGIMAAWDGQEDALIQRFEKQARVRDGILRYYASAWPERSQEAVLIAQEWLGVEGELLKQLPKIPAGPVPFVMNPDKPALATRRSLSARQQVIQFFRVYKPEHLAEVDSIMEAFEGREDWLLMTLRRQYLGDSDLTNMLDHSFLKPEMKAAFRTLCAHWNPAACEELEELFWQFRGTEEEFILHMCALGRGAETVANVCSVPQSPSSSDCEIPSAQPQPSNHPLDNATREEPPNNATKIATAKNAVESAPDADTKQKKRHPRKAPVEGGESGSATESTVFVPCTTTDGVREELLPRESAPQSIQIASEKTESPHSAASASAEAGKRVQSDPLNSLTEEEVAPKVHSDRQERGDRHESEANPKPKPPKKVRATAAGEALSPVGSLLDADDNANEGNLERVAKREERKQRRRTTEGSAGATALPPDFTAATNADPLLQADPTAPTCADGDDAALRDQYANFLAWWSSGQRAKEVVDAAQNTGPPFLAAVSAPPTATVADPLPPSSTASRQEEIRLAEATHNRRGRSVPDPNDLFRNLSSPQSFRAASTNLRRFEDASHLVLTPRGGRNETKSALLTEGSQTFALSNALASVDASALYSVCLAQDIDVHVFKTLQPSDLKALGVSDPRLLDAPSRLRKMR